MRCLQTIVSLFLMAALAACAQTTERTMQVGSKTTTADALTPGTVAAQVEIIERERDIIYRAPTLRVGRTVNVGRLGPVAGANLGATELGRSGFLLGVRHRDTGGVHHFAGYNSDFVAGTNRFTAVRTAEGQSLKFSLATADQNHCPDGCKLTFQTLMIEVPETLLRGVPDTGLTLILTLDNGHELPMSAPAAYVRGYLQVVDEAKP